jgi:hypothetical protein
MSENVKSKIDKKSESVRNGVENPTKPHKPHTLLLPAPSAECIAEDKKRKEREMTTIRKRLFLDVWSQTLGAVKATCERTKIPRRTYYDWMRDDPEFAQAIYGSRAAMLEDLDQLGKLQCLKGDGSMIRFYLERLHPDFKAKLKLEGGPAVGEKSLEQEFDEINWMNDNKYYGNTIEQLNGNTKPAEDPKQKGIVSPIPS